MSEVEQVPTSLLIVRMLIIVLMSTYYTIKTLFIMLFEWVQNYGNYFVTKHHPKPKALEGWNHKFMKLSTSVELHYVESGDQSNPLMLCLHGFPEFWYTWRYQIRHFDKKYRVVAVDLRGYGDSSKPKGYKNYKLDLIVDDIIAAIGALGSKSAIVMAHDWGGVVAWRLAVRRPDLVEKLIQINSPHSKVYNELLKNPVQRKMSWYLFLFQCPYLPEIYLKAGDYKWPEDTFRSPKTGIKHQENFTEEDMAAWKFTYSRPGSLTPPINYYRAAMRQFRPTPFPKELIQPTTLLIWSIEDAYLVPEAADLTVPLCREIVLKKIKNASHWAHQDCPELVNQYIEEFLGQP